jgi:hypothetical protein
MMDGNGVTAAAAAEFFGELWSMHCSDPVTIEAFSFVPDCPFQGCVAWDGLAKRWQVLLNADVEPFDLLKTAFHELYHVTSGDVQKTFGPLVIEQRAIARGKGKLSQRVKASMAQSDPSFESECDDWAYKQARAWWPTLQSWRDPQKAAKVAWWVHRAIQKLESGG